MPVAIIPLCMREEWIDAAFARMAKERSDAVVVQASLPLKAIADLALKYRLPVATSSRQFVEAWLHRKDRTKRRINAFMVLATLIATVAAVIAATPIIKAWWAARL